MSLSLDTTIHKEQHDSAGSECAKQNIYFILTAIFSEIQAAIIINKLSCQKHTNIKEPVEKAHSGHNYKEMKKRLGPKYP